MGAGSPPDGTQTGGIDDPAPDMGGIRKAPSDSSKDAKTSTLRTPLSHGGGKPLQWLFGYAGALEEAYLIPQLPQDGTLSIGAEMAMAAQVIALGPKATLSAIGANRGRSRFLAASAAIGFLRTHGPSLGFPEGLLPLEDG